MPPSDVVSSPLSGALPPERVPLAPIPSRVGLEKTLTTTTPASPTVVTPAEVLNPRMAAVVQDAFPGMLQTLYRGLVASNTHGQAAPADQLPFWEHSHLYVEETSRITPLGEDGGHHSSPSHQGPQHPLPHENLTEEAHSAYQAQVDLDEVLLRAAEEQSGVPTAAEHPPPLDIAG